MEIRVRALIVIAAMTSAFLVVSPSNATVGTLMVTEDTVLAEDHRGPIEIVADGVTLDCDGHVVSGKGLEPPATTGILVRGRSGVTIQDCTVEGFDAVGVEIDGTLGSTFVGNTVNGVPVGFRVADAHGNTLVGDTVTGAAEGTAFAFSEASGNTVTGNTAESSAVGFLLSNAATSGNALKHNTVRGGDGYVVSSAVENLLFENFASGASFLIEAGARGNDVIGNRAINGGFYVEFSSDNDLADNSSYRGGFAENNAWIEAGETRILNTYSGNRCLGYRYEPRSSYPDGLCARGPAGSDRFSTAARISMSTFDPGVEVAYIATGTDFPDALAAVPVAALDRSPILLVLAESVPEATAQELVRLQPQSIVILGGTAAVSEAVESRLADYTTGPVRRLAGPDRYATAAAISRSAFSSDVDHVYVAVGSDFSDALAGGPMAAVRGYPILLVTKDGIPEATAKELRRLEPFAITILGGTATISPDVQRQLRAFAPGTVSRLAGVDRFATAAEVSFDAFLSDVEVIHVVTGADFPDALTAGVVAGMRRGPILLVTQHTVPAPTSTELDRLDPLHIVVVGGTNAVSTAIENDLAVHVH